MMTAQVAWRGDFAFLLVVSIFESVVPIGTCRRRFDLAGHLRVAGKLQVGTGGYRRQGRPAEASTASHHNRTILITAVKFYAIFVRMMKILFEMVLTTVLHSLLHIDLGVIHNPSIIRGETVKELGCGRNGGVENRIGSIDGQARAEGPSGKGANESIWIDGGRSIRGRVERPICRRSLSVTERPTEQLPPSLLPSSTRREETYSA